MDKKGILIIGATGFIGKAIIQKLDSSVYDIYIASRNLENARKIFPENKYNFISLTDSSEQQLVEALINCSIIINLAGENIGNKRWTDRQKEKIFDSRLIVGSILNALLAKHGIRPEVYIQASAIGYYGNQGEKRLTEMNEVGKGFLAEVCDAWESSACVARSTSKTDYILRIGLVIGKEALIVKKLKLAFKWAGGVKIGRKNQMISWIHIDDLAEIVLLMINQKLEKGEYNLVAPNAEYAHDFYRLFAKSLNRFTWFVIPPKILQIIFGQMAEEVLLSGQNAFPEKLLMNNYKFKYPSLKEAFENILRN